MAQEQANSGNNLKIVSVVWFKVLPPKYGGQKGTALFNKYLAEQSSLICICSKNNQPENEKYPVINSLPNSKFQFINFFSWWKIYKVVKDSSATHLILEYPYYGLAGFFIKKTLRVKLIIHGHNIEWQRFKEQKKWWWKLLYYYEKCTYRVVDLAFVKSTIDKKQVEKDFGIAEKKVVVLEYVSDEVAVVNKEKSRQIIEQRHGIDSKKIFLFAGTLDYLPNAEAVKAIYEIIVPELKKKNLDFKLIICGRNENKKFEDLKDLFHSNVIYSGEVMDIEKYFLAADVFINPVFSGGGVQTKTIDALNYGLKVVCFKSKSLSIINPNLISVADGDWSGFVAAITDAALKKVEAIASGPILNNGREQATKAIAALQNL